MSRVLRLRSACGSPWERGAGTVAAGPGLLYGYNPPLTVIDGVLDRTRAF